MGIADLGFHSKNGMFALLTIVSLIPGYAYAADPAGLPIFSETQYNSVLGNDEAISDNLRELSENQIDLNTASLEQLTELPVLTYEIARRILAQRKMKGKFSDLRELLEVIGIDELELAQLAPFVYVEYNVDLIFPM